MTAEVAIMNRGAVALAADSAMTVQTRAGAKVYNTVNKLFRGLREIPERQGSRARRSDPQLALLESIRLVVGTGS